MKISRVNWGEVGEPRPDWARASGRLCAVWPSPVDHDRCFAAAGFTDFEDSDALWWRDFGDLVVRLFGTLERLGPAVLREGELPGEVTGRPALAEALLTAATDDNFPPCLVEFGAPAQASIRASQGHALLWVWVAEPPGLDGLLSSVAMGQELRQLSLKWDRLA